MKIMAIDFGHSRTGLAVCDKLEILASPLCVIQENDINILIKKITKEILDNKIEEVIIGFPKNMDGSIGDTAKTTKFLASELKKILPNISFILWDERNSTKQASTFLNNTNTYGKKRKKIIDAVAATIILESYMQFKKLNKSNI